MFSHLMEIISAGNRIAENQSDHRPKRYAI